MVNKNFVTDARIGLNKSRIEASEELSSMALANQYRGNETAKENGNIVKKMVEEFERNLIGK